MKKVLMKHCEFLNFKNLMNSNLINHLSIDDKFYTIIPKGSSGVEVEMSKEVYLLFGYGE
jgi:hypothetical protein